MMADDLRSLERTERMMVRWMCGVSLKDRKRREDLCNLLGINCVADVVRRGRMRWFGHLERKSVDDDTVFTASTQFLGMKNFFLKNSLKFN